MKRLRRWLFNLAAGVSVVLLIAATVLWVRSYFAMDSFTQLTKGSETSLCSYTGSLGILYLIESNTTGAFFYSTESPVDVLSGIKSWLQVWESGGFAFGYRPQSYFIQFPFWSLAGIAAILPLMRLRLLLRERRTTPRGRCTNCGYDLRATPDRCPECGTVPDGAKGATT